MQTIGYNELVKMLRGAVEQVRQNHEHLSKLDSFGGDGDHGTTMLRAMEIVEKTVGASSAKPPGALLQEVGWAVMGVDGGATGPLFGTLFMSMGEAATEAMDVAGVSAMFEAGLAGLQKRTKAKVGDKTMLDALVPAVEAIKAAAGGGADVMGALQAGAEGAARGAAATKEMQAKFGRAKNVGAKSIGNQDAGATSVSLVFKGFWDGLKS